jgi:hypothetical protein
MTNTNMTPGDCAVKPPQFWAGFDSGQLGESVQRGAASLTFPQFVAVFWTIKHNLRHRTRLTTVLQWLVQDAREGVLPAIHTLDELIEFVLGRPRRVSKFGCVEHSRTTMACFKVWESYACACAEWDRLTPAVRP